MHNGQKESEPDQKNPKFYLMIVPAHGKPECKEFATKDALVDELRSLANKRVSCYVFEGERWHISLPPRKLIAPDGTVDADISYSPNSVAIDMEGFLFDDLTVVDDDEDFETE